MPNLEVISHRTIGIFCPSLHAQIWVVQKTNLANLAESPTLESCTTQDPKRTPLRLLLSPFSAQGSTIWLMNKT
ncbi:hypothetical protein PNOK_0201500 [Pyrrhoderma noxium]|uniref:Uncharacterized protein n=1 Tax=Pyrrhoderma noxium TaxID=2282107 RepID=A0A286UR36_9AGAM|nr:hypothetical protein PNOK_0201500 [Pyrrhoderma noxium]